MSDFDPKGGPGKPCTSMKCRFTGGKTVPTASFYFRRENRWVCVWCAQELNGRDMALKIPKEHRSCIPGAQYTYEQLLK